LNKYLEAKSWCLAHGIKIYIVPIQYRKDVYVEVDNNGKITRSPKTYKNQKIASDKIWDLNLYLYEKNKKNGKD
jgi:hypothetical protein|tara:strand:+ start:520 stop:741 length:222 start_codon:yes stop_codon:yes gene_type:complete